MQLSAIGTCGERPQQQSGRVEWAALPLVAMQTMRITMQACRVPWGVKPMLVHAGTPLRARAKCMEVHGRMGDHYPVHAVRWQDAAKPCTATQALYHVKCHIRCCMEQCLAVVEPRLPSAQHGQITAMQALV